MHLELNHMFTIFYYKGINISFAVACEEFPHELGNKMNFTELNQVDFCL